MSILGEGQSCVMEPVKCFEHMSSQTKPFIRFTQRASTLLKLNLRGEGQTSTFLKCPSIPMLDLFSPLTFISLGLCGVSTEMFHMILLYGFAKVLFEDRVPLLKAQTLRTIDVV